MLLTNPHAVRCAYPSSLRQLLNIDKAAESRRWLRCWPEQFSSPSPVWALAGQQHSALQWVQCGEFSHSVKNTALHCRHAEF